MTWNRSRTATLLAIAFCVIQVTAASHDAAAQDAYGAVAIVLDDGTTVEGVLIDKLPHGYLVGQADRTIVVPYSRVRRFSVGGPPSSQPPTPTPTEGRGVPPAPGPRPTRPSPPPVPRPYPPAAAPPAAPTAGIAPPAPPVKEPHKGPGDL